MFPVLFALLQQVAPPQPSALPPSPVTRIVITPANLVVMAQDTLRIRAQALDANGQVVPQARVRIFASGGRFEGSVDSTGLVRSGSTGTLPVTIQAIVPGTRPVIQVVQVRMVPGPATTISVSGVPKRLLAGQQVRAEATAWSAAGDKRDERVSWRSSSPATVSVSSDGLVTAKVAGRAILTASAGNATMTIPVTVIADDLASFTISPAIAEGRTGDVVRFTASATTRAGRKIEGLVPSWSFAPGQGQIDGDGTFVGYDSRPYTIVATLGRRSAQATAQLRPRDVRRPAQVVGRLPRTRFTTEEVWIHPSGKYAYLGSGSGGDVMYAIDISNPANPTVTDSIIANTRRVNDIMTTPDGKFLVFTREGASDRKNGIVIAELSDPAHPKPISEFTEGVTAGVHSAYVYRQEKFGTHVYITNDGTGALHVIDISDPYKPKEIAQWKTARPDAGRTLHDIDIQNGLLYASYWNDGLIILDIGNGIKGGSPSNPQLVTQFKYDLNDLYRQVEASGGAGFIRGTHTAWRHKNYVFIADEVFPASGVLGGKDASAGRAYGRMQVVDVSDLDHPKSVAWYEPEYGGVHNVWVAGDTLYMGAYNGGFRAFDVSGELRGDLRAQAREMVHVNTADKDGFVPNAAMTWGVVVNPVDGLAYVNDMYNGLWIVRLLPQREKVVQ